MSESTPVYGLPYLGKDDTLKETTDVAASSAAAIEGELVRLDEKDVEQDDRLDVVEARFDATDDGWAVDSWESAGKVVPGSSTFEDWLTPQGSVSSNVAVPNHDPGSLGTITKFKFHRETWRNGYVPDWQAIQPKDRIHWIASNETSYTSSWTVVAVTQDGDHWIIEVDPNTFEEDPSDQAWDSYLASFKTNRITVTRNVGGVPPGGLTNQVLVKASNADFATKWATPSSGGGGGGNGADWRFPDFRVTREYVVRYSSPTSNPWEHPEWAPGVQLSVNKSTVTPPTEFQWSSLSSRGLCHPLDVNGDPEPVWEWLKAHRLRWFDITGAGTEKNGNHDPMQVVAWYAHNETTNVISWTKDDFITSSGQKPFYNMGTDDSSWYWGGPSSFGPRLHDGDIITCGSFDVSNPPSFPFATTVYEDPALEDLA